MTTPTPSEPSLWPSAKAALTDLGIPGASSTAGRIRSADAIGTPLRKLTLTTIAGTPAALALDLDGTLHLSAHCPAAVRLAGEDGVISLIASDPAVLLTRPDAVVVLDWAAAVAAVAAAPLAPRVRIIAPAAQPHLAAPLAQAIPATVTVEYAETVAGDPLPTAPWLAVRSTWRNVEEALAEIALPRVTAAVRSALTIDFAVGKPTRLVVVSAANRSRKVLALLSTGEIIGACPPAAIPADRLDAVLDPACPLIVTTSLDGLDLLDPAAGVIAITDREGWQPLAWAGVPMRAGRVVKVHHPAGAPMSEAMAWADSVAAEAAVVYCAGGDETAADDTPPWVGGDIIPLGDGLYIDRRRYRITRGYGDDATVVCTAIITAYTAIDMPDADRLPGTVEPQPVTIKLQTAGDFGSLTPTEITVVIPPAVLTRPDQWDRYLDGAAAGKVEWHGSPQLLAAVISRQIARVGRTADVQYVSTGWHSTAAGPAYVLGDAAMTATGVVTSIRNRPGSLAPIPGGGWGFGDLAGRSPAEVLREFAAVMDLLSPRMRALAIGSIFAASAPHTERKETIVSYTGPSMAGKTYAAWVVVSAWVHGLAPGPIHTAKASRAAVQDLTRIYRDLVLLLDDVTIDENRSRTMDSLEPVAIIKQAIADGQWPERKDGTGVRRCPTPDVVAMFTAEVSNTKTQTANRELSVRLEPARGRAGSVTSVFARWLSDAELAVWANQVKGGAVNRGWTAAVQWMAQHHDALRAESSARLTAAHGRLGALCAERGVQAAHRQLRKLAWLLDGHDVYRRLMLEVAGVDMPDAIDDLLDAVIDHIELTSDVTGQSLMAKALRDLKGALLAGRVHFATSTGRPPALPDELLGSAGWQLVETHAQVGLDGDGKPIYAAAKGAAPRGSCVGTIDGNLNVVLRTGQLAAAMRWTAEQERSFFADLKGHLSSTGWPVDDHGGKLRTETATVGRKRSQRLNTCLVPLRAIMGLAPDQELGEGRQAELAESAALIAAIKDRAEASDAAA